MGRLDITIEIERQRQRARDRKSQRSRRILSASIRDEQQVSSSQGVDTDDGPHNHIMDLELYEAAAEDDADGFLEVLQGLDLDLPAISDQVTPLKNTILHVAAASGNSKIVELIVDLYPWLSAKTNSNGGTALHIAAKSGDAYSVSLIVEFLKKAGEFDDSPSSGTGSSRVSVDDDQPFRKKNKQGNTAVHVALINGHQSVALDLFMADPQVLYCLNQEGESPLYLAAETGYKSCVRIMLKDPVVGENPNVGLKGKSLVMPRNSP